MKVLKPFILSSWEAKIMLKLLYTDIRNILFSTGIKLCVLASLAYLVGTVVISEIILHYFNATMNADQIVTVYPSISIFVVTAATLLIFIREYSDGIIKNKMCSGAKRSSIFLSAVTSSALIAFIMSAINQIVSIGVALILTEGFYNMTAAEIAWSFLENIIVSVAIAVFSTSLIMIMGGKNASYVIGLGIAFVFKIIGMEVADKLYPEKGLCQLTGLKLTLYTFYDRFVPYAHSDGMPRWGLGSTLAGSVGTIVLAMVIGLIVFRKKEIK